MELGSEIGGWWAFQEQRKQPQVAQFNTFKTFSPFLGTLVPPNLLRNYCLRYFSALLFAPSGSLTRLLPLFGGALGGFQRSLEAARVEPGLKGCGHGRGWWWGLSVGARTADVVSPGPESSGCRGAAGPGRERRELPGAGQWKCQRSLCFVCTVSNFIVEKRSSCDLLTCVRRGSALSITKGYGFASLFV